MKLWKLGIVALVGVMLAGTVVGIVAAQTDGDVPTDVAPQKAQRFAELLPRLAANLGITPEELTAAIQQTQLELVDERLAAGDITEDEAARIRARIEAGEGPGFGGGHGGKRGHERDRYAMQELAEFLGLTPQEIASAKQAGQSLAEIGEANGVSAAELAGFFMSKIEAHIAEALAAGKIDQARADEVLQNAPERIDRMINRTGTPGEGGHGRFQPSRFPAPAGVGDAPLL